MQSVINELSIMNQANPGLICLEDIYNKFVIQIPQFLMVGNWNRSIELFNFQNCLFH